jgi:hypothetical protein
MDPAAPIPSERYAPRAVRFLGALPLAGWGIKRYAITAAGRAADDAVVDDVLGRMAAALPEPGTVEHGMADNGLAIVIAHFDEHAVWYLLDRWVDGSTLKQTMWRAPMETPAAAVDITRAGHLACVWELGVIDHERRLWIETMMGPTPTPERYLSQGYTGTV